MTITKQRPTEPPLPDNQEELANNDLPRDNNNSDDEEVISSEERAALNSTSGLCNNSGSRDPLSGMITTTCGSKRISIDEVTDKNVVKMLRSLETNIVRGKKRPSFKIQSAGSRKSISFKQMGRDLSPGLANVKRIKVCHKKEKPPNLPTPNGVEFVHLVMKQTAESNAGNKANVP